MTLVFASSGPGITRARFRPSGSSWASLSRSTTRWRRSVFPDVSYRFLRLGSSPDGLRFFSAACFPLH